MCPANRVRPLPLALRRNIPLSIMDCGHGGWRDVLHPQVSVLTPECAFVKVDNGSGNDAELRSNNPVLVFPGWMY